MFIRLYTAPSVTWNANENVCTIFQLVKAFNFPPSLQPLRITDEDTSLYDRSSAMPGASELAQDFHALAPPIQYLVYSNG